MNASTETLLGDVRSALHQRRIWSPSPDKDRPGFHRLRHGVPEERHHSGLLGNPQTPAADG